MDYEIVIRYIDGKKTKSTVSSNALGQAFLDLKGCLNSQVVEVEISPTKRDKGMIIIPNIWKG